MALTRAQTLLTKLNEELTALEGSPLPPLIVEQVWIKGLYQGLRSISLILNDVVLAASGVDPDEAPEGKANETPASGVSPDGSEALP
jgi:hypothetical protein